jgi:hypothetical protein
MNNKPPTVVTGLLGKTGSISVDERRAGHPIQAQVSLDQLTSDVARLHAVQIVASMEVKRTFWRWAPALVWAFLMGLAAVISQLR